MHCSELAIVDGDIGQYVRSRFEQMIKLVVPWNDQENNRDKEELLKAGKNGVVTVCDCEDSRDECTADREQPENIPSTSYELTDTEANTSDHYVG